MKKFITPVAFSVALALTVAGCYDDSQDEYSKDPATTVCLSEVPVAAVHFPMRTDGKQKLANAADSTITCLKNLFGNARANHPMVFDTSYNGVFNYHKTEVPDIFGDGVSRKKSFLVKLNHTTEFDFFLFRTETGLEMEGAFYDVLFTVDSKGALVNHILAGATETMYQREVIVNGKNSFTLKETTGSEENDGPSWSASFHIEKNGKFTVTESEVGLPLTVGADELESLLTHESSSSFLVIDKKYKRDLEQGIKDQLFAGEGQEAYFQKLGKKDNVAYLAVLKNEGGNLILFVIHSPSNEAPTDPDGNYVHRTNSIVIANPADDPDFAGVVFKNVTYGVSQGGKHMDITLEVIQHWSNADRPENKELTRDVLKTYSLEYDSETGIKVTSEE